MLLSSRGAEVHPRHLMAYPPNFLPRVGSNAVLFSGIT
jgi:hypothetical protein